VAPRSWVLAVFLLITFLSAVAVLAAAIGWLPHVTPQLVSWGIPAVLGEIVVTVIVFFRGQWAQKLRINIAFEGANASDVILDVSNCSYEVHDTAGELVQKGKVGPSLGPGGWQIELSASVQENHFVILSLHSQDGRDWQVRPFLPFVHKQTAYPTRI
jgi:hypothetical protein